MDTSAVIDLAREAFWITMLVSAPVLLVVLVVGLGVGLIQAATSINEMTLSFIPKLVASAVAILLFGHWQLQILTDYIRTVFQRIPGLFN